MSRKLGTWLMVLALAVAWCLGCSSQGSGPTATSPTHAGRLPPGAPPPQ
ncbi:MAG: hypothetical protein RMI91_11350 [Gemmatales bacterium]|nr:hypothetical protein [Gemmatales bacterium]MDW7995239.1 hypothetical protein [Gemmatales bacterium]